MTIEVMLTSGEYCHLKDLPTSTLPTDLMAWFETSKQIMELPTAICHYVKNKTLKEMAGFEITQVGAMGCAYEDGSFAFVETDLPELHGDKRTMIHEMLHLKDWLHGDVTHRDYEDEVTRLYDIVRSSNRRTKT